MLIDKFLIFVTLSRGHFDLGTFRLLSGSNKSNVPLTVRL